MSEELKELAMSLSRASSLDESLRLCLAVAIRVAEMDGGGIYLLDREHVSMRLATQQGLSEEWATRQVHEDSDTSIWPEEADDSPLYTNSDEMPRTSRKLLDGLRALAWVPILFEGRLIAGLFLASRQRDNVPDSARRAVEAIGALSSGFISRSLVFADLTASEARYREIFNGTNDAIWVHDMATFKFIDVNRQVTEIFGYSVREALDLSVEDISSGVYPFVRETAARYLKKAAAGEPQIFEWHAKHKDGHLFWTEVSLRHATIVGRECILAIERDITERKRVEKDLVHARSFSDQLIDAMPGIFYMYDSRLRLRRWNQNHELLLGYSPQELTGKSIRDLYKTEASAEQASMSIDTILEKGGTASFEAPLLHRDGHDIPFLLTATRIDSPEGPAIFGFGIDITQRRQAEKEKEKLQAQLTQAQKMEAVGRLAGGVAHDFNNMLGAIFGFTELAQRKVEPNSPVLVDLQEILKAAQRSAELTRQLLAFARKQTVAPVVLDLNKTIATMLKLLRRLIGEDIDLAWKPGKDLWSVMVDPAQIDQVLANLCVNARDAIAGVGRVTVETGNVVFDDEYCALHAGYAPGEFVLLALSDNGCGMDAETLGHLFEPFFTTKATGKGTGLGLASVLGAVKQNNGFVNVYSEPGQGTTFKIYLPRHGANALPVAPDQRPPSLARGNATILLVEDDPSILNLARQMLELLGYTVLAARTPGEAMGLAGDHSGRIDLLVTDVVLPEMNGRDLAKKLHSICPNIRRLFMSGYTANVIAHHGVLDPGVHFIQKPFSMEELSSKVQQALIGT